MGGGLLQLLAVGRQNENLTGNPQISFFKQLFRRHTNFGKEQFRQDFVGKKRLGQRIRCEIERKGDLLGAMYLVFDTAIQDDLAIDRLGHKLIEYIEVEIGGQTIDTHYGEWLDIWTKLTYTAEKYDLLTKMLDGSTMFNSAAVTESSLSYVPLLFWFNTNPGLALPLIALQSHSIIVYLKIKDAKDIRFYGPGLDVRQLSDTIAAARFINDVYLYCDYIFLDIEERTWFANEDHNLLITQVQSSDKTTMKSVNNAKNTVQTVLYFNHPVKELIWYAYLEDFEGLYFYKNKDNSAILDDIELIINNTPFTRIHHRNYYTMVQPFQHHTCGGLVRSNSPPADPGGFYVYSFAMEPEKAQPTGTLNFSKINDALLQYSYRSSEPGCTTFVRGFFAINYNVLQLYNGMAKLKYEV
tara:strand:- start:8949 stop:10184 length:1236 start_codon:yes stop_codon:yes gene_type:complete